MSLQPIYIVGIGGTGTGALAGLLKEAGHPVTGSDVGLYPPMSDRLAAWGIDVHLGYDAAHLDNFAGQVIVGNVIRADNPEAMAIASRKLPCMSMAQAVAHYGIGERHSIVLAGTHGKTTTTALTAHLLKAAGRDPGYLIGGAPVGGGPQAHLGGGNFFVVEGDEYDTAYFDKGPKFLHYRGRTVVITSLEFDHADIFADVAAVQAAFAKLITQVPQDGTLVLWHGAKLARALVTPELACRVLTYGADADPAQNEDKPDLTMAHYRTDASGLHFQASVQGRLLAPMQVPLWGSYSADNVLAALAAVQAANLTDAQLAAGFASFTGVRRRMEVVGEGSGITLVDDFGHHPTAVAVTLAAARERWPGRRLWALFEPRSATSRRKIFEAEYIRALAVADCAVVAHHPRLDEVHEDERFSPERVARGLKAAGVMAAALEGTGEIVGHLREHCRPGDVVLVLSNGDFAGLIPKLQQAWGVR